MRKERRGRGRYNLQFSRGVFLEEVMMIIVVEIRSRDRGKLSFLCFAVMGLLFGEENEN